MKQLILLFMFTSLTAFATENEQFYGPVKAGDMLWNIAGAVRPASNLNRYQVMMALFAINPEAFKIPCNINSLQVGKTLKIPDIATIQQLTETQALAQFEQHKAIWQTYRQSGKPIVCTEENRENVSKTLLDTSIVEPIKSIDEPIVSTPTSPFLSIDEELSAYHFDNKEVKKIIAPTTSHSTQHILPVKNTVIPLKFHELMIQDLTTLISQPLMTIPISIIIFAFSLLCAITLLILWLIRQLLRYILRPAPTNKANDRIEPSFENNVTLPFSSVQTNNAMQTVDEIKEKLAIIRSYLADGEEATLHHLLQDVMKKGTGEQQAEARQLIEINRKMQLLQQKNLSSTSLLENELDLKEKLTDTYHSGYKQSSLLETEEYSVMNPKERMLGEEVSHSPKPANKSTRYLV